MGEDRRTSSHFLVRKYVCILQCCGYPLFSLPGMVPAGGNPNCTEVIAGEIGVETHEACPTVAFLAHLQHLRDGRREPPFYVASRLTETSESPRVYPTKLKLLRRLA